MNFEQEAIAAPSRTNQSTEADHSKPGLIFDADAVSLTGQFTDELSAYRARRAWSEIFGGSFLLEHGRDYEMKVRPSENGPYYVLCTVFHSACGRYAFWRLVNHQTPEAEAKLYAKNLINKRSVRFMLGSIWSSQNSTPWILQSQAKLNHAEDKTVTHPKFGRRTGILHTLFQALNRLASPR